MNTRIKEIRKSARLTMKEFAKILGISQSAISRIEKGERNISDQLILLICHTFNVNEEWLRFGTGEKYNKIDEELALIISYILEETNPFYDIILEIAKTYQQIDQKSKDVIKRFCENLIQNIQQKEEK